MKVALRFGVMVAALAATLLPTRAHAETFTFSHCLENNSGLCEDVADQLEVEVTPSLESGWVNFTFTNAVGIASSLTDIYFDATGFLTKMKIVAESSGVSFTAGSASPPAVPGGGSATPPFEVSSSLMADSNPPSQPNGVNSASEFLTISFKMAAGITFDEVIAALELGPNTDAGIRIAAHVQGVGPRGESDALICCDGVDNSVPGAEPASLSLFALAATGAAYRLRRRQRHDSTPA